MASITRPRRPERAVLVAPVLVAALVRAGCAVVNVAGAAVSVAGGAAAVAAVRSAARSSAAPSRSPARWSRRRSTSSLRAAPRWRPPNEPFLDDRPHIHFIGGEKGGVGKSLMARVLAQYLIDQRAALPRLRHRPLARRADALLSGVRVAGGGRQGRVARRDRRGRGRPARAGASWSTSRRRRTIRSPRWMEEAGVISLADELGMKLFYWHVMDSGKDSVDLLRRLLDRFGTGLHYVPGSQPGARRRLQRARAIGRAGARDRHGRERRLGEEAATSSAIQKIDAASSSFWQGQGVRQGLDRPRPDGPAARQDVAARRLPRDRRRRRLNRRDAPAEGGFVAGATARRRRCRGWRAGRAPPTCRASRSASPRASRAPTAWCCGRDSPAHALPGRVAVRWEVADDEQLPQRRRPRRARAPKPAGRTASTPSRAASSRRAGTGTASARSASRAQSAGTRTAPAADAAATLRFAIASCQRYDVGHYAAWRHVAGARPRPGAVPRRLHLRVRPPAADPMRRSRRRRDLHPGPVPRPLRDLQERSALQAAHAAAPWLLVWDDHEVSNDYAGAARARPRGRLTRAPRRRLPRLLGAHAVRRRRRGRPAPTMRIVGRLDWGTAGTASISSTTASTATPRSCPLPGRRRIEHGRPDAVPGARSIRRARCSAPSRSNGSPTAGTCARPWNLVAQQTLMARMAWQRPGPGRRLLDRRLGRLSRRRGTACSARSRRRESLASSSSAATCTATTSPTSRPTTTTRRRRSSPASSAAPRSRACRCRSAHRRRARLQPAHPLRPRRPARLRQLRARCRPAARRAQVVDRPLDPDSGGITTAARFVVDAGRPGAHPG